MGSADEGFVDDVVGKAVHAANLAKAAKKKAEQAASEALKMARKEMKRKARAIELRKTESAKKTMRSYFECSRGGGATACVCA